MLKTTTATPILSPEQVYELLVEPVYAQSIAAQVCTVVRTSASSFRIPKVTADPVASWVAEGDEITPSDLTLAETDVALRKLAGLSVITRELAEDSSPEASAAVGDGLARDIARKLDQAFFANTTINGPAGLGSLTPSTVVSTATAFGVDDFVDAIAAAADVNALLDNFVVAPADFVALSKVKQTSTSNVPLLQPDPAKPSGRLILGVPLLTSTAVTAGTAYGVPKARTFLVVRDDTSVDTDESVFFTSDRIAVRATMRVGLGYPHEAAIVELTHA